MFEDEEFYSGENIKENINRFEKMLKENEQYFFDVSAFEDILDFYLEINNAKKAFRLIEIATLQHPDSAIILLRKAQLLASDNKPQKALEILSKLESIEPFNVEVYLTKGNIFSQLRQYNKALESFKKALEYAEEDLDDIYLSIAFEYTNIGNYIQAIAHLKKALLENPENESALFELAFCYEITGKAEESIQYYSEFIDNHPYSSSAWFNLGVAYSKISLFEKAIDAYDYAIVIDENFSSAYFNKANALVGLEKYKEAIAVYTETFSHEEPDALTFYYIGECYEKMENYNKALTYFNKASKLDPFLADAWVGKGVVLDVLNRPNESIHYINKAIDIEKNNADYLYILADLQKKRGFMEEAQAAYKKVAELEPENEEIWLDYSDTFYEQGDIETAIEIISEGIKKQSGNADLIYRITAYHIAAGSYNDAYDLFELGLQTDFEKHSLLFDYAPELKSNTMLIDLIDLHKSK